MWASVIAFVAVTFVISLWLTWWVRRLALESGMIDHPNERSSHAAPTPRGGGLAIVLASAIGIVGLYSFRIIDGSLTLAMLGGGLPIAWVGFRDDRGSMSVRLRFVVHVAAGVWAIYILGSVPPVQLGSHIFDPGILGDAVGVVSIVWALNLFNFMDGVDGLAGSEAVFVTFCGAMLGLLGVDSSPTSFVALILCAASLGFLVWNWPPARIFLGDVGSGYLGYTIAVVGFAATRENPIAPLIWWILVGVFFVDATVTFIRRLVRGEDVYQAHRSHGYQHLALRWGSHRRITLVVLAANLCWLLPLAWLCQRNPLYAPRIALLSLAPLIVIAIAVGAGKERMSK